MENLIKLGGTQILRNPNLLPLEESQVKQFSPVIFAKKPMPGVSDVYGHVPTIDVVRALRDTGFELVEVRQSKRRDESKMGFTKHMLKFAQQGSKGKLKKVGDMIPQVVMLNSHDRSSGFHLYYGLFRLACENGLIVSAGELVEPIKVRHTISMTADIVERSKTLVRGADGVYALREQMLSVEMTQKQAIAYAQESLQYRPPRRTGIMDPATLLQVRRAGDEPNNLWMVYNRIQENMLRGGAATVTEGGRSVNTKGIGRIERDVEVNGKLWEQAVRALEQRGKKSAPAAKKTKRVERELSAEEADI